MAQCQYINPETQRRCRANAVVVKDGTDPKYCYFHNPDIPLAEKQAARLKGGQRMKDKPLPAKELKTPEQIKEHLAELVNLVRQNRIPDRKAALINNISTNLLKSIEVADIDSKVQELLDHLDEQNYDHN